MRHWKTENLIKGLKRCDILENEVISWGELEKRINNGIKIFRDISINIVDKNVSSLKGIEFYSCNFLTHMPEKIIRCIFADCKFNELNNINFMFSRITRCIFLNRTIVNCNFLLVNLEYCNLIDLIIEGCNFKKCNISNTKLIESSIRNTKFSNTKTNSGTYGFNLSCPEEGSFIAYKKVNNHLIKLLIPSDAKRSSATTLKCRCSYAKVLEITNLYTNENVDSILNKNTYGDTLYKVNEFVYPDSWDDNRWNECSHGIHFFMNKNNAINY